MVQHFQSYLRPLRRRWGFTQGELAFLIGYQTGKSISRIEALKQTPTLNAALSCAVIFNTAPVKLFPGTLFDAAGLALFAVSGAHKALVHGLNPVMATLLGMLTGAGNGPVS